MLENKFKLIVGIGNVGGNFEKTRHNIGFMMVDAIAKHFKFDNFIEKGQCLLTRGMINNSKVILAKPTNYVNNSGGSIAPLVNFYKILPEEILVLHDDLAFNFGKVRFKQGGSSGGHNGLKDLDAFISAAYYRLRFGISRPQVDQDVSSYVLGKFRDFQLSFIEEFMPIFIKYLPQIMMMNVVDFQNEINSKIIKEN